MRQFLSTQVIPHELNPYFKRDVELEKTLEKKEKCFIYRFMVGKIKKPAEAIFEDPCLGTKSPKPAVMQPV